MPIKWHEHGAFVTYSILLIYVSINIHYLDLHVSFMQKMDLDSF